MEIKICAAKIAGRRHIKGGINCQDNLNAIGFVYKDKRYVVGIIADGCSEGTNSETGSALAVQFAALKIRQLILEGVSQNIVPILLYQQIVDFLRDIVKKHQFPTASDEVLYIRDHFLFTVIGFIVGPETTTVFSAGDGVIQINDDVQTIFQNNKAAYLGYHLIDRRYLDNPSPLSTSFDTTEMPTESVQRLAIGSDAWLDELHLMNEIWGVTKSVQLQRRLNVWSENQHRFSDDASIITATITRSSLVIVNTELNSPTGDTENTPDQQ